MRKFSCKILSVVLLIISCLSMFSCGEEDCASMKHSREYDTTVTVKIDDKEADKFYFRYDSKEFWIYPESGMELLEVNAVSKGEHKLSLEFKEGLSRCKTNSIRLLTIDGKWSSKALDEIIVDFQCQGNSAQGTFQIPEGIEKEYSKLYFEMDVAFHIHKKGVCYSGNGLYYFGVELV